MRLRWLLCTIASVCLGLGLAAVGSEDTKPASKDLAGTWTGTLKPVPSLPSVELRIVLNVTREADGTLKATMVSPDQSPDKVAVDTITSEGDRVRFEIKKIGGSYEGTRNDSGEEIAGTWKQGAGTFPLTLRPGKPQEAAALEVPKDLEGLWVGPLKAGGIELRIVIRVEKDEASKPLKAILDSPDQGEMKIPVSTMSLDQDKLEFTVKSIAGSFEGRLDREKNQIVGTWEQLGNKFPLTLGKTDKIEPPKRPQTPKPPYPYKEVEVSYPSKAADVTLAGTLTVPEGAGPFPVVLLITGSGPQDRDETLFSHKPFLVLADYLTRRGVAVLRVDDRGVGRSTGSMEKATSLDFVEDVLGGVAFLKTRAEVDPKHIGLIGHSEGGLIAPIVATKTDDVAFIVLMAGTGLPGDWIIRRQTELITRATGESEDKTTKTVELQSKLMEIAKKVSDPAQLEEALKPLMKDITELLPSSESDKEKKEFTPEMLKSMASRLLSPWMRTFLTLDPRDYLRKVKCPVLAINGENDLQVPPKEDLGEIEKALKEAGNEHATIVEIPGLNHLFQTSKTGSPAEYGKIEETIAPAALQRIGDWIESQTRGH